MLAGASVRRQPPPWHDNLGVELQLTGRTPLKHAVVLGGYGPDVMVIDASKMEFASPFDLAGIAATAHWAAGASLRVQLVLPDDPGVAGYMQRMNVIRHMPSRIQITGRMPPDMREDRAGTLLEVTPLTPANVDDVLERIGPIITSYYGADHGARGAAFRACGELVANATEHGASAQGAFVAVQVHTGASGDAPRLEFAVCDTGMGVMAHLRQNPSYSYFNQDKYAIQHAMRAGVSGIQDEGRGNGLSDTIKDTCSTGALDFRVRSGRGEVRVTGADGCPQETLFDRSDQTSGTWAWLTHRLSVESKTMIQSGK